MVTLIQQIVIGAGRRLRRAARGPRLLGLLLLGLLLVQPALCAIHCATDFHLSRAAHTNHTQHLLCSLAHNDAAPGMHVFVPAFWPSLPATLLIVLLLIGLPQALLAPAPAHPRWLRWSPPSPPPRQA